MFSGAVGSIVSIVKAALSADYGSPKFAYTSNSDVYIGTMDRKSYPTLRIPANLVDEISWFHEWE